MPMTMTHAKAFPTKDRLDQTGPKCFMSRSCGDLCSNRDTSCNYPFSQIFKQHPCEINRAFRRDDRTKTIPTIVGSAAAVENGF